MLQTSAPPGSPVLDHLNRSRRVRYKNTCVKVLELLRRLCFAHFYQRVREIFRRHANMRSNCGFVAHFLTLLENYAVIFKCYGLKLIHTSKKVT